MILRDVVVTGAGVLCAGAADLDELREVRDDVHVPARRIAGDPGSRLTPNQARRLDRLSQILLIAAKEAAARASLAGIDGDRVGLVVGTGLGCLEKTEEQLRGIAHVGQRQVDPLGFADTMDNAAAAHTAIELGCRGPSLTLRERELSGEFALLVGAALLDSGQADAVVVVAGDAASSMAERMLPACAPGRFSGEGAGAIVIESGSAARRRDAPVLARITGRGRAIGGRSGEGPLALARSRALTMAGRALEETLVVPEEALAERIGWCPGGGILRVILAILLVGREGRPALVSGAARGGAAAAIVLAPPEAS